jgi:hypothetical protein
MSQPNRIYPHLLHFTVRWSFCALIDTVAAADLIVFAMGFVYGKDRHEK